MDKTIKQLCDLIYNSENCQIITKEDMLVDLKTIVDKYNKEKLGLEPLCGKLKDEKPSIQIMFFKAGHREFKSKELSAAYNVARKLGNDIYDYEVDAEMSDAVIILVNQNITQKTANIICKAIMSFSNKLDDWEMDLVDSEDVIYMWDGKNISYIIEDNTKEKYKNS